MTRRWLRSLLLLSLAGASLCWGQSELPAAIGGNALRPSYSGEAEQQNYITARFRASAQVDDNALNDNKNKVTDVVSTFEPAVTWNFSRPRWQWMMEYAPSLTYSQEIANYRRFSQALNSAFQLHPSARLTLRLRNSFTRTSDPFVRLEQPATVPGFGALDQPNPSLFGQSLQYTSEQVGADVTYLLGPHTSAGVSGNYSMVSYDDIYTGTSLSQDVNSVGARAFISQKLSPVRSIGAAYNYQMVDSGAYGRTLVHSIMLFHSFQLNRNVSLSFYGGPEHIETTAGSLAPLYAIEPGWSWMAGGGFAWRAARTGITGSVVHRVSNAGSFGGGAVQLTSMSGRISRKLAKKWSGSLNVSYAINSSAFGILSDQLGYLSAGAGLSHELYRNLGLSVTYLYTHQTREQTLLGLFGNTLLADHNRVSIGLSYSFSRPLGR